MKQKIKDILRKKWVKLACCVLCVATVASLVVFCFIKVNESYEHLDGKCSFCDCKAVYKFPIEDNKDAVFCPECFASCLSENPDELYKLYSSSRYAF